MIANWVYHDVDSVIPKKWGVSKGKTNVESKMH